MLYGLLDLPLWGYVVLTLVVTHITVTAVTLYLHRDATHRGLDLHPALRHFFRFWLWVTTGMITKEWVAIHRKHHARCETEEDPHSPKILGLKKVLFEGAELYEAEAANPETLEKFGRGTPDDWMERNVYTRHKRLGIYLMLGINLVLLGVPGLTVWAIQMITIPFLAAGIINGVGHFWGYRNFECKDAATNVMPWGILMGGEELHNNHHAFPSSARFSLRRWEFDIGWQYVRALRALGLAKVRREAPRLVADEPNGMPDLDTVKAVINGRMHVLRDYTRRVTLPVFHHEIQARGGRMLRKAKALLVREPALLDESAQSDLAVVLDRHPPLKTIHDFRERLTHIWERTAHSNEKLMEQFRDWCRQAEQSGIDSLEQFARRLRGYRLARA